ASLSGLLAVGRLLLEAEDDEFCGEDRSEPDDADQPPVVEIVLAHRGAVAANEERLVLGGPGERACLPDGGEKRAYRLPDQRPQLLVVRLEDHPLGPDEDRFLDVDE